MLSGNYTEPTSPGVKHRIWDWIWRKQQRLSCIQNLNGWRYSRNAGHSSLLGMRFSNQTNETVKQKNKIEKKTVASEFEREDERKECKLSTRKV